MAAPKKNENDKYHKSIRVKLLEKEHVRLKELVLASGNTISEVIRELIITGVTITRFSEAEGDLNTLVKFMTDLKNNYVKSYHDRKD